MILVLNKDIKAGQPDLDHPKKYKYTYARCGNDLQNMRFVANLMIGLYNYCLRMDITDKQMLEYISGKPYRWRLQ